MLVKTSLDRLQCPHIIFGLLLLTNAVFTMPPNDKTLFNDNDIESRKHKRRRPCRGRGVDPQGRTFFDWNLHYVNVNYDYNYNINCGGGGGGGHGGGGSFPIGGGGSHGGGNRPQKPLLSGLLQGVGNVVGNTLSDSGSLLGSNGPISFVQSQFQGILANPPSGPSQSGSGQHQEGLLSNIGSSLGSLFQEGLFNGQGISSLFENGLFSGIFDSRPQTPASNVPSYPPSRPITTTTFKPTTQDPDDIIYNDEKPVHEDHDPVFPDIYSKPGQYIVASNSLLGQYVFDLNGPNSGYNRKINRQINNREINRFTKSFENLLKF